MGHFCLPFPFPKGAGNAPNDRSHLSLCGSLILPGVSPSHKHKWILFQASKAAFGRILASCSPAELHCPGLVGTGDMSLAIATCGVATRTGDRGPVAQLPSWWFGAGFGGLLGGLPINPEGKGVQFPKPPIQTTDQGQPDCPSHGKRKIIPVAT